MPLFQFNPDPLQEGEVDIWLVTAYQSPELSIEGNSWRGTGWVYQLQTHTPVGESGTIMPDHLYTIDRSNGIWTAMGGNGANGMSVLYVRDGVIERSRALASGTVTSRWEDGEYTIEVDALDSNGVEVTLSVKGAPPAPANAPGR